MKTSDKILEKIKWEGFVTAKQLSEEFNMTNMGARQHLQALEDSGLLAFFDQKVKVGRPTRHWQLTVKGHARFADQHGELSVQLIEAVETAFGKEGIQKVVDEREKQIVQRYRQALIGANRFEDKVQRLASLRKEDHYMVELKKVDNEFILTENHCPICKVAQACPNLCQSELHIFQQLLGENCFIDRIEHIVQNGRKCVYRIRESAAI